MYAALSRRNTPQHAQLKTKRVSCDGNPEVRQIARIDAHGSKTISSGGGGGRGGVAMATADHMHALAQEVQRPLKPRA
eukprot:5851425-Amphidinium_carterae.1